MRKTTLVILSQIVLFFAVNQISAKAADAPVEVTAVKEVGLSDADETKSVIEIQWRTNTALTANVGSFKILLSIFYADGTTKFITRYADEESVSVKIEVPSVSSAKRLPPAYIKEMKAMVVALSEKNQKIQ